MENNKIIIKVPNELKKDLSNTKALAWEENESFFQSVDLRNEPTLKWYFEWYKVLYFEILRRLYNPLNIFQRKALKKELKEVKTKLLQFEKVLDEMYWKIFFEEKWFFSLNLETNVKAENKLKLNKLDYFLFIVNELSNKNQDLENKNETIKDKIFTQINYIINIFQYEKNLVWFSILDRESIYHFLWKSDALNNYLFRKYFKDYEKYKEEIKKRLDDEDWKMKNWIRELLNIIREKKEWLKFVLWLYQDTKIKKID